ncbi:hypothetical protein AB0J14_38420 [Micromonospora arborensis]|uniref:hypothetical protein n=1 Tax=Micromonospora arborensis TaxID=2116518 RepID=UPI00340697B7
MSSELVASSDIPFGDPGRGVFAFRKGDRVPAELVESNGWEDFVSASPKAEPTTTKASERKGS